MKNGDTCRERVAQIMKDGFHNHRAVVVEYHKRFGEYPNGESVRRYMDRNTRKTRAFCIYCRAYLPRVALAVAVVIIAVCIAGIVAKSSELSENMRGMYPGTSGAYSIAAR